MKLSKKVTFILLAFLILSCTSPERKGLTAENRLYTSVSIDYECQDEIEYIMSDYILELNQLSLDNICIKAISQLDTTLGAEFISTTTKEQIREKLVENYFSLEEEIQEGNLLIGSNNLWNAENPEKIFNLNTISPKELDWKMMMHFGYPNPVILETTVGKWAIKQTIVPCIGSNWKEIGQFKKIEKRNNQTNALPNYQYQFEMDIIIHLTITDNETAKKEHYTTTLSDTPKGYTVTNLRKLYRLDGKKVPNPSTIERKEIKFMKTITKQ